MVNLQGEPDQVGNDNLILISLKFFNLGHNFSHEFPLDLVICGW